MLSAMWIAAALAGGLLACGAGERGSAGEAAAASLEAKTSDPDATSGPRVEPAQSVVLVSIDTLRADHVGGYGYERDTCPEIDAFARRGTVFLNAISPAAWTVPAHMTMMTGLDPLTHGLLAHPDPGRLAARVTTLAERLKRAGFRTAAFTGGSYMAARYGIAQGFDVFDSRGMRFASKVTALFRWLDGVGPDERFFLFLHGYDCHGPYKPPPPYDREFAGDYQGTFDTAEFEPRIPKPDEPTLRWVVSQYDGAIKSADHVVGGILRRLEAEGRLDDTLVVITSDHGEEMYEHGSIEHTHSLYDELVRVPLIFVGPNVPVARVEEQVGLVDLFPTVLDRLGIEPPADLPGRPVFAPGRAAVAGAAPRPVFSYVDYSVYPYRLASVRTDDWKLIAWNLSGMKDFDWRSHRPRRYTFRFKQRHEDWTELFDLHADPGEQHDVAAEHPELVRDLTALLEAHRAEATREHNAPEQVEGADDEVRAAMKALGYVDEE